MKHQEEPELIACEVCGFYFTKGSTHLLSCPFKKEGFTGTRYEPYGVVHEAESYGVLKMRPSWDEYFLDIAKVVATRADCTRRKVGAVIVKNNRIISTGYNGAPAGKPGCLTDGACPRGKLTYEEQPKDIGYANCGSVHAESNAIIYAHQDLRDATLYCTDKPCVECEKLIAGAGIKTVITP